MYIKQVRNGFLGRWHEHSGAQVDLWPFFLLQVIIEGFKSYREQVATEPFSPKVNCVGKRSCQAQ